MVERIEHGGALIAIIIRAEFKKEGIEFFTPNEFSQQLAYMNRPAGYMIAPHTHRRVTRSVHFTLETLFVRKGKVKVDFYSSESEPIGSKVLKTGDVILQAGGGHSFTMLEDTEMIEVKQGPYAGELDKIKIEVKKSA
jgi:mannose-6-phosphate isomerase-like protein (cupin superfamily)